MTRDVPATIADVIPRVSFKVYQAKGRRGQEGVWHAHVSGLVRGDLDDLRMRSAAVTAHALALAIERKVAESGVSREEVLRSYGSRYRVEPNGHGEWVDVGHCYSEDEARTRACAIVGHVFGRRLARRLDTYVPRPEPVRAPREVAFA